MLTECVPRDLISLFKLTALKIAGGQRTHHIDDLKDVSSPFLGEQGGLAGHPHSSESQLQSAFVAFFVMYTHTTVSMYSDGL